LAAFDSVDHAILLQRREAAFWLVLTCKTQPAEGRKLELFLVVGYIRGDMTACRQSSFPVLTGPNNNNNNKQHPFNGLFSRTTWVSWYQKGRTILYFNEARDDGLAVPSAGPNANHLHVTPDRQPNQHLIT